MYLNPRLYKHPNYFQVINLAKSKGSDYKLLDVGSCFGQEVRGLIADGVSPSSITITDLHDYYWKAGKRLYFDDESNKLDGVTTIFGDFATDPADIEKDISQDLTASFDCVICQAIFHVLSKKQSHFMIQRLFNVLKPGGILLGQCVGAPQAREWAFTPDGSAPRWLYSAESLTKELKSAGFTGEVKVTSETRWEFFMLTFYAVK
jgi:SAM-dependent methyltransferase